MQKIVTTVVNPDVVWTAYVEKGGIKDVLAALVTQQAYSFAVENDLGGSGMWKIIFDAEYDRPDIEKMLGYLVDHVSRWEV
jgi:hypothetical protein